MHLEVASPVLRNISAYFRRPNRNASPHRHLMLAGISQDAFLREWGSPEIEINLDQIEGCYKSGLLKVESENREGEPVHSVWIYKKKDRIFFFTRKRLVSHFKWSDFKEKQIPSLEIFHSPGDTKKKLPAFMATPLSLVS